MNRETQIRVAEGQQYNGFIGNHDPKRIGICFGAQSIAVMLEDLILRLLPRD